MTEETAVRGVARTSLYAVSGVKLVASCCYKSVFQAGWQHDQGPGCYLLRFPRHHLFSAFIMSVGFLTVFQTI